ncbi:amino acid ABC transporter substrate-binding protein [soil metagenome]
MGKFSVAAAVGLGAILASGTAMAGKDLDAIKARGAVICGVPTGLAGFAVADSQGKWVGLDIDVCRAVSAAIFGDSEKVKYVPLTSQQRFTALQSSEVDLLSNNTTITLQRDTALGLDFTAITYYDGQGFMVPKKLGLKSAKELNGATVCVAPGTTTELNLADYFRANKMSFKPVVIEKVEEIRAAFFSGRCDVYTTDVSGLAATRAANVPAPLTADDFIILPEIISKEPLGPMVRHGDHQFTDIVRWAQYAMVEAEEYGITSKNVDEMLKSENPTIKRILGVTPGMGKALGVDEKWVYNIIKQVGNYGESFDKHVGPNSLLKIDRGVNKLWTQGGLQYAPPIR